MAMCRLAHNTLGRIAAIPKVFIAQIRGHALGGGLEIALACDLRFAAEGEYYLGVPEVTLGLLPGNGGTQRLPRLIGWNRALDLMVTGRRLAPKEALAMGILDRLFPADQIEAQTRAYVQGLVDGAASAIGAIKVAVQQGRDRTLDDALRIEREMLETLFRSPDGHEGVKAFVEKRKPQFNKPA
jgi:enoyl-CoA hydratase/carnithine racemase